MRLFRRVSPVLALACALSAPPWLTASAEEVFDWTEPPEASTLDPGSRAALDHFLDKLRIAESGGRDDARNPRSTAVGPYQFIETTFLDVVRRSFEAETRGRTVAQVLALRSDPVFARKAVTAFTLENARALAANGADPTFANLRLAHLLGPVGAVRILKGDPSTPVIQVLGALVVQANPFMAGMTAKDLTAWSARNLAAGAGAATRIAAPSVVGPAPTGATLAAIPTPPPAKPQKPAITVTCNLDLASCRKWLALAERMAAKAVAPGRAKGRKIAARQPVS